MLTMLMLLFFGFTACGADNEGGADAADTVGKQTYE